MKITNKQILCIGEVLWDRLPSGAKPGGAPMNVALHLHAIGQDASIASRIGNDQPGRDLKTFLENSGLSTEFIQTDENLPTSEVLVHLDENNNATYEICEPVAWDNLQLTESLAEKAKKSGVLIYGSLASRNQQSRQTLLKLLEVDALKLIDVNLRKPYERRELVEPLLRKSDVIKLNDDELSVFAAWHAKQDLDEQQLIEWVADHYDAKLVCVTKGENGARLFCEGRFYNHAGFKINAVDTVGAGDAFLAGLLAALFDHKTYDEALAFACATGAFVASKAGATPEYNMQEIERILFSN
ncbi:carbohydrate kinase [uncultured Sunxiuqinia sp.]|jgi:fructokinase|uniref:carbohydrate kinase family protein n=1 Tax=uncultured Sunxiuqinia sp. TaxID=1573825 RepID=UPI0030DD3B55|tara:strand:+ start:16747 stop:17643 length:897 start_codon:yes stop_codon:yes gene_type:complete